MCFSMFLFENCTKDDPPEPTDEILDFIEKDIGSEGSILELDEIMIEIPSGTFESTNKITLSKLNTSNEELEGQITQTYKLEGLPIKVSNPINVMLTSTQTMTESVFIVIEEEAWSKTMNALVKGHRMLPTEVNANEVSGMIMPYNGNDEGKDNASIMTRDNEKVAFNLLAVAGYVSVKSENNHFQVNTPSAYLDQVLDFTEYLEIAYEKFKDLGFDYSKRTNWPAVVNIKSLKAGTSGYSVNSLWGNNYGYIEVNKSVVESSEHAKVTAGHEFFHLIQNLYDPRNVFSKAKLTCPHLWLDEAMSTWSEELFSAKENYVSPVFIESSTYPLAGAKIGDEDDANNYGYGMASLIKYIVKHNGTEILTKIYNNIASDKAAFLAVSSELSGTISMEFEKFVKEFLAFEIYKNDDFGPGWFAAAAGTSGTFLVDGPEDTLKNFKLSYPDLSARIFYLKNNNYKDFSGNTVINFKIKNPDGYKIILYKFNSTTSEIIAEGRDSVSFDGLKSIVDEDYKLAGVVIQDELSLPYDSEQEINMDITIESTFQYDYVTLDVNGIGSTKIDKIDSFWGDTTYIFEGYGIFRTSIDMKNYEHQHSVSGNTIISTASFTDIYEISHQYTFKSTFNNISNPTEIIRFEYSDNYTHGNALTATSGTENLVLTNIPFVGFDTYNQSYNFFVWDGCSANVESYYFYEKTEENNGDSTTRSLESCDFSGAYIQLKYNLRK